MIRILLVEHDSEQKRIAQEHFLKQPDINILAVSNAHQALEMLAEHHHDLILLNRDLPVINGLELLSRIQSRWPRLPAIVYGSERDAAHIALPYPEYHLLLSQSLLHCLIALPDWIRIRLRPPGERYRQLVEVILQMTTPLKADLVMQAILDGARRLMASPAAMMLLWDAVGKEFRTAATRGITFANGLTGPIEQMGVFSSLAQKRPLRLDDLAHHPESPATPAHHPRMFNLLAIPFDRGSLRGSLAVANRVGGYSSEDEEILKAFSVQAVTTFQNAQLHEEVRQLARTDGLTGLYNHREMEQRLQEEIDRFNRYARPFSVLMIDIDHFKSVNDAFGHHVGDQILRTVSQRIVGTVRTVDIATRYGGEEFLVILPETTGGGAYHAAEKIRHAIAAATFRVPPTGVVQISASIGVACFPLDASDRPALIQAADRALYLAKVNGRNRTHTSRQSEGEEGISSGTLARLLADPNVRILADLARSHEGRLPHFRESVRGLIDLALVLADPLELSDQERADLWIAGALHHVGLLTVPEAILAKERQLQRWEKTIVRQHPQAAEAMMRRIPLLATAAETLRHHHDPYRGSRDPMGLKGKAIPRLARILSVAESYLAMISPRPYRSALSKEAALMELQREAGRQLDPHLVELFVRVQSDREMQAMKWRT